QLALRAAKPPRRVVGLLGGERPPLTLAADRDDMTGELAKQIAARNPRRHSHALRRRRVVGGELDLEKMAARIEQPHTITNQRRSSLSAHVREAAADGPSRLDEGILAYSCKRSGLLLSFGQAVLFGVKRERSSKLRLSPQL